jgi:hypothetical protein
MGNREFLNLYNENKQAAITEQVDNCDCCKLLGKWIGQEKKWKGTCAELLTELQKFNVEVAGSAYYGYKLPETAFKLSGLLNRNMTSLEQVKRIKIERGKSNGVKYIAIEAL